MVVILFVSCGQTTTNKNDDKQAVKPSTVEETLLNKGNQFDRTDKIKVAFYFENEEGGTFDFDYFREVHIPLVIKLQKQYGLLSIEIEKGIAGETEDAPIPNVVVATLIFKSFDLLLQSDPVADELNADVPKFTNIRPVIQVSKIIEVQSAK